MKPMATEDEVYKALRDGAEDTGLFVNGAADALLRQAAEVMANDPENFE